jgi:hypothetical protein
VAYDFIKAVSEFGLYGVMPDEDSAVWLYGFEQTITSIGKAKDRYTAAVENGKKGGRKPTVSKEQALELKAQGLTNKQVAEQLNCSVSTIEKINAENRKNQKNLNDNVNVNDNKNENINEKNEELLANANNSKCLSAGADSHSISLGGGASVREMTIDNALMLGVDTAALEAAGNDMNKICRALGF